MNLDYLSPLFFVFFFGFSKVESNNQHEFIKMRFSGPARIKPHMKMLL